MEPYRRRKRVGVMVRTSPSSLDGGKVSADPQTRKAKTFHNTTKTIAHKDQTSNCVDSP